MCILLCLGTMTTQRDVSYLNKIPQQHKNTSAGIALKGIESIHCNCVLEFMKHDFSLYL